MKKSKNSSRSTTFSSTPEFLLLVNATSLQNRIFTFKNVVGYQNFLLDKKMKQIECTIAKKSLNKI